jgi:hypothetical protein
MERIKLFFILLLAFILLIALPGCDSFQFIFRNPRYTYENGAILVRGDDRPIELKNNEQAVNVPYAKLLAFIREDFTDEHQYVPRGSSGAEPFVCSDFAEMLHNNAEAAGIRAGYLTIDFASGGTGHAINAFQTLDKGMVYIDCTGQSAFSQLEEDSAPESAGGWDKVAYIEVGKKYGVIALDKARSPDYEFYDEFEQKWQEYKEKLAAYNAEVKQFNLEITEKVYRRGSPELARIQDWEVRLSQQEDYLTALEQEIGTTRFKPLEVVKNTNLHW